MNPTTLYNPTKDHFVGQDAKLTPIAWSFLQSLTLGLSSIDLSDQVTGVLAAGNGGTGVNNGNRTLALAGTLTTVGSFATVLTMTGATAVTLPTSGTLLTKDSAITATELTVTNGVTADSGGIKHARVTTGSIGSGASALVTVTWVTPFANANYTVSASVVDGTAAVASLSVVHVETVTAAAVAVRVQNTSAGALTGSLHVIAMHE